jgi:hypothetical protein
MTERAPSLLEAVAAFLDAAGWEYEQDSSAPLLYLHFVGETGDWPCAAFVLEEQRRFAFFSRLPVTVPESVRPAMAEFITRANFGMAVGCFEMDFADGDLRFKTSLDTGGEPLTDALLEPLIWLNVATMERYLPGVLDVVAGGEPVAALARVEESGQ